MVIERLGQPDIYFSPHGGGGGGKDFTSQNHRKEVDALKRSLTESELENMVFKILSAPVTAPTKLGRFLVKTALDAFKEKKAGK